MHPYAGNAALFIPTVDLIDDSDAPNASNFNVGPQGALDRTAYLYPRLVQPGTDWQEVFASTTPIAALSADPVTIGAATWSYALNAWVMGFVDQTTQKLWTYYNYGLDANDPTQWQQLGASYVDQGPVLHLVALATDPDYTTHWAASETTGSSFIKLYTLLSPTSSWATSRNRSGVTSVVLGTFGQNPSGQLIAYWSDGMISSTDNHGSTWSDFNSPNANPGFLAIGPNGVVAISVGTVCYSSDGVTWNTTVIADPGYACAGVAWDPTRSLFVSIQQHTSGPLNFHVWTSPDGAVWTNRHTGPVPHYLTHNLLIESLAIIGGNYVCSCLEGVSTGTSVQIYSSDGGATWFIGNAFLLTNLASSNGFFVPPTVASGPNQLISFNANWGRFSRLSGLPTESL